MQLKFYSGVAKVKVAETPQVYATKKSFEASDKAVYG
jgi:hypothetical protein